MAVGSNQRFDLQDHMAVLAAASSLMDEFALSFRHTRNRLLVSHPGLAHPYIDLSVLYQLVLKDLQVQLAHAADDRLPGIRVDFVSEGGILPSQRFQCVRQFGTLSRRPGLDRHRNDGLRKADTGQHHGFLRVAKSVARQGMPQPHHGDDIPRLRRFQDLPLTSVHLKDPHDVFLLVPLGVQDPGARLERALIEPQEVQVPVDITDDLESQRDQTGIRVAPHRNPFRLVVRLMPDNHGPLERRGQIIHDPVEEPLDTYVFQRRTHEDGIQSVLECAFPDGPPEGLLPGRLIVDECIHDRLIVFGRRLDHSSAVLFRPAGKLRGDVRLVKLRAQFLGLIEDGLHRKQVDNAREGIFRSHRNLHHHRICDQLVVDALDAHLEIGARFVHLVDKAQAGQAVLLALPPDGLALRLDALTAVKDGDRAVEHSQRPFDLSREVDVARRIDQIDVKALPGALRRGGRDRDPSPLLFLQVIHHGRAIMDLPHLIGLARIVENALRHRRLAGVDMRHDANVPYSVQLTHFHALPI